MWQRRKKQRKPQLDYADKETLSPTTQTQIPNQPTSTKPNHIAQMSAQNQGRQSPEPEDSSNKQTGAPSGGQGVNKEAGEKNKEESKNALEGLESNPAGPLDAHLKETMKKTETPDAKK
ncbi:hypothetical protein WAI453_002936 [Rhynchosporium graminicola]